MRQLARFEEEEPARVLADTLYLEGIAGRVDEGRDGAFLLWVEDERHMERAQELLALFEKSPDDPRFAQSQKEAAARRKQAARKRAAVEKKAEAARVRFESRTKPGYGRVTLGIIFTCVGLAFAMLLTDYDAILAWLNYVEYERVGESHIRFYPFGGLREGQVWRLFTPAFVHAELLGTGVFHLFFNMYWFKDLGSLVERNRSGWFLLFFVLVTAAFGSTFGYAVWGEAQAVGMSGVILGLYGYAFARGRIEKNDDWAMPTSWGLWLIGFYLVNLFGLIPGLSIANGVHTGGLIAGVVWGVVAALVVVSRRGRR
jgi:GlpG protein